MKRPGPPLFLERDSYRRRRVMDAARVLPVLGALLFLVPLLWGPQHTPAPDTAWGGIYIFAVWGGLILGAFLLSRRLGAIETSARGDRPETGAAVPPESTTESAKAAGSTAERTAPGGERG